MATAAARTAAAPARRRTVEDFSREDATRSAAAVQTRAGLRARAQGHRRLSFGVAVIGVAGVLLAGVVGVNVMVLRQNVQLDQASRARTKLRAENAALTSQVSAAVSASRIEGLAQRTLGLQSVSPEDTTYIDLGRAK